MKADSSSADRDPVGVLAEEFAERLRRGEHPSVTEYVGRFPELADEIRELFPALAMMEQLKPETANRTGQFDEAAAGPAKRLERLGDYRILREVGRGSMGVVYEAEQESLGRHVPLKVLLGAALHNPQTLLRFRREARSAARLHHTNIVPVFGVGEHEGAHYYVMQFIHGKGLDEVIKELKQFRGKNLTLRPGATQHPSATGQPPAAVSAAEIAHAFATAQFARGLSATGDRDSDAAIESQGAPARQALPDGPTESVAEADANHGSPLGTRSKSTGRTPARFER